MDIYVCSVCGHEYNPSRGEQKQNIPPGIAFEKLPPDWTCPVCCAEKSLFRKV